jgi:hypothetical protein
LTDLFLRKQPSFESYKFFPCYLENKSNIQINVKIVMRKSDGKVLYAQGEKYFADILLSFLSFPLGAVVRVLGGNCSIGNIDSLYKSIVDLVESKYFMSQEAKNRLVDPHLALLFINIQKIIPVEKPNFGYDCYYQGYNYEQSIKDDKFFITDKCRSEWGKSVMLEVELPKASDEGYVKGPRAYMVTDDLYGIQSPQQLSKLVEIVMNRFLSQIEIDDLKLVLRFLGFGSFLVCLCLF